VSYARLTDIISNLGNLNLDGVHKRTHTRNYNEYQRKRMEKQERSIINCFKEVTKCKKLYAYKYISEM